MKVPSQQEQGRAESSNHLAPSRSITIFASTLRLSVSNLFANKLRTFLTLLGIIVGVAAMISVVTIIKGLDQTVASTFSANGSTVFTLSKAPSVITSREEMIKAVEEGFAWPEATEE